MAPHAHDTRLSWSGQPLGELLRLAWPIVISMVSYSTMTLVDTLFIGRLGSAPLAGVGLGGLFIWVLVCFPFGLMQGAKILVAQALGAGRTDEAGQHLAAAQVFALLLGGLLGLTGMALSGPLDRLAASEGAATAFRAYVVIRSMGVPLILLCVALREVRQGLGDSRSPMVAAVFANIVNISLDYLLIVHLDLGVEGAAWATVAATAVELFALMAWQRVAGPASSAIGWTPIRELWRMGWPVGLQFFIEMSSFTVLSALVSRYGELDMAAHQIVIQIIHFSFLPAVALGEACSVLAGQAVGAGRPELVRPVARLGLLVAGAYTGACALVMGFGGQTLSSFFTDRSDLVALAARLLLIAAAFQVFDAANIIARGTLKGTGDVRFTALLGTLASWLVSPPCMLLFGYGLGWGVAGAWIGICLELMLVSLVFWWRLWRGGWERVRPALLHEPPAKPAEDAALPTEPIGRDRACACGRALPPGIRAPSLLCEEDNPR